MQVSAQHPDLRPFRAAGAALFVEKRLWRRRPPSVCSLPSPLQTGSARGIGPGLKAGHGTWEHEVLRCTLPSQGTFLRGADPEPGAMEPLSLAGGPVLGDSGR